jgi:excisionase family DNA binding protein
MSTREPLLNASEVADEVGVDAETVRRWVRQGHLAAVHLPTGRLRFHRTDVDALLSAERASVR